MTNTAINYRQRFVELALQVAEEFQVPASGSPIAGHEQDPQLCLQLQIGPWAVRLVHGSSSGAVSLEAAVVEIVIGIPVAENAVQLYAHLLESNQSEWPAAYAMDEQTGELLYAFRVALQAPEPAIVARTISHALLAFFNWQDEGAVTLPSAAFSASETLSLQ